MKPQDLQTLALAALTAPAIKPTAADALAAKVDQLGAINAALATMKKQADQIRAELEDAGLTDIEGHLYRVNSPNAQAAPLQTGKQSRNDSSQAPN